MNIQLTIIGLGQIGASIGLALSDHTQQIVRTGSDIETGTMQLAKKMGAVDKTSMNLGNAVRDADIVIVAIPQDQINDMIKAIAPELKEGAVLMDTAPVKVQVTNCVTETLPQGRSYVGLTPILNPKYLFTEEFGLNAAKADLFQNGMFGITNLPDVNPKAINLAADLAKLVGAAPFFTDIYEIDGVMAAVHLLPHLLSVALLNATLDQPGWSEARKVAGRAFAEVTGPASHLDDVDALAMAAIGNRENVIRTLDNVIRAMQLIRNNVAEGDSAILIERIKHARTGVAQWWKERGGANWLAQELPRSADVVPTSKDVMGGIFGFGSGRRKKRE